MGTIAIILNPNQLTHPDLDLRYVLPDTMAELTHGKLSDNGYDYLDDESNTMVVYMRSKQPKEDVKEVAEILKNHTFLENKLYGVAELYISEAEDSDSLDDYEPVVFSELPG